MLALMLKDGLDDFLMSLPTQVSKTFFFLCFKYVLCINEFLNGTGGRWEAKDSQHKELDSPEALLHCLGITHRWVGRRGFQNESKVGS